VRASYVIPLVAFGFTGVESIAVTAFEAKSSKSLRLPSQIMAYVIFFLYFLCTLGEVLNVKWNNDHLPIIYGGIGGSGFVGGNLQSTSITIIATWEAGFYKLAGFLNGALIFSVLSAANTSLYVASRTLYGLTREIPRTSFLGRRLNDLSYVTPKTGVPVVALLISAVSFFWLPFLQLRKGYAVQDVCIHMVSNIRHKPAQLTPFY
jgi:amino acid transporter